MGCNSSQVGNKERTYVLKAITPVDKSIHKRLEPLLDLTNKSNINAKYEFMIQYVKDELIGQGIYQTQKFNCKQPVDMLERKRNEFWELKVIHCLGQLQELVQKIETKVIQIEAAVKTLYDANIKLVGKSLQLSYDKNKNKYELPIFIINEPSEFIKPKQVVQDEFEQDKEVKVQMRFASKSEEFQSKLSQKILFLYAKAKKLIEESGQEFQPENHEIQLIFRGKVMLQDKFLGNYLKSNGVIQVFKKGKHKD